VLRSSYLQYLSDQVTVLNEIPNYTPQLNGTAERHIRTVMNVIRSMLKAAGVTQIYVMHVTSRIGAQVQRNRLLLDFGFSETRHLSLQDLRRQGLHVCPQAKEEVGG